MITAIWFVMRTGIPWRDLPAQFGPWSSVYTRFRRWSQAGLWARMQALLAAPACGNIRSVDCSQVKTHADGANPAGGQSSQALGRTKGGLNTKIAVVVDGVGRAVQVALARGPRNDLHACAPLWPSRCGRWVVADRGCDADGFRRQLAHSGALICIPPRVGRRIAYDYSRTLYRHRHTMENFFARLKRLRRIATRYEKLASHFLAFVLFATVIDWLRFEV